MKNYLKIVYRTALFVFLLSSYGAISFFEPLTHNHKYDGKFHKDCFACQFENQVQQDDSSTDVILNKLTNLPILPVQNLVLQSIILTEQYFKSANYSRGPPYFI